jgi:hypothetical protein
LTEKPIEAKTIQEKQPPTQVTSWAGKKEEFRIKLKDGDTRNGSPMIPNGGGGVGHKGKHKQEQ